MVVVPSQVWVVSFSPDGRLLASASRDGGCRIWITGATTGPGSGGGGGCGSAGVCEPRLLYTLHGHTADTPSHHMSWNSDSTQLLSVSSRNVGDKASILRWEVPVPAVVAEHVVEGERRGRKDHRDERENAVGPAVGSSTGPHSSEAGKVEHLVCRQRYELHAGDISCAEWVPSLCRPRLASDLQFFVSGGIDRQLLLCDQWGVCLGRLVGARVGSLAILLPTPPPTSPSDVIGGGRWMSCDQSPRTASAVSRGLGNDQTVHRAGEQDNGGYQCRDFPESNYARRVSARRSLVGYRVAYVSAETTVRVVVVQARDWALLSRVDDPRLEDREPWFVFVELASLLVDKPVMSLSLSSGYSLVCACSSLGLGDTHCSTADGDCDGDGNEGGSRQWGAGSCGSRLCLQQRLGSTSLLLSLEGGGLDLVDIQVTTLYFADDRMHRSCVFGRVRVRVRGLVAAVPLSSPSTGNNMFCYGIS